MWSYLEIQTNTKKHFRYTFTLVKFIHKCVSLVCIGLILHINGSQRINPVLSHSTSHILACVLSRLVNYCSGYVVFFHTHSVFTPKDHNIVEEKNMHCPSGKAFFSEKPVRKRDMLCMCRWIVFFIYLRPVYVFFQIFRSPCSRILKFLMK